MMDLASAREAAEKFVTELEHQSGIELMILDDYTRELESGWVFFWDSKKHVESGSISDAIAGNAPIIVSKRDRSVHLTGTAYPIEYYIRRFEESQST
jgi:hypothetical protein